MAPTMPPLDRLTAFDSEEDLAEFLRELARTQRPSRVGNMAETVTVSAAASTAESVTNVQHAGVDEGGIVKVCGDYLVVLRRGRLFTVGIGDDTLTPVAAVDAFGPDIDPQGTWYDEMLVAGRTVVVVGYSYSRGGTELGLFDVDRRGHIRYRATYHLRSDDYYSSRNYASRAIGQKLIFYAPTPLWPSEKDPLRTLPALRRWRPGATSDDFRPIYAAHRIRRPLLNSDNLTLHTVTTCDLGTAELTCSADSVMGPPGRVFYVSSQAVYIWMTQWAEVQNQEPQSLLYRLPLDGSATGALGVFGGPVDQFSFLERDGYLNVLVRTDAAGDGMWRAALAQGDVALLRLPVTSFGARPRYVSREKYRPLPKPDDDEFQNRFVGEHLLYGTGNDWGAPDDEKTGALVAYRYATGEEPSVLVLNHAVDRIDALGRDAVVVGSSGEDLHLTTLSLARRPRIVDHAVRPQAAQGETRSHGFFYLPDGGKTGTIGLPVGAGGRPGYEHLFEGSAAVLFLRNEDLKLETLGQLAAEEKKAPDDACRASCVDWYGNARPLFLRGRILALLGYEIVEGGIEDRRIHERRRVSFAPPAVR